MNVKNRKRHYSSANIVALLAQRHSKDVFVPECKDGATQTRSHVRLDAWAMNRSWANACSFGYEIKVSRADFVQDNKWPAYLKLCNQFYFVAPPNLIDPAELSPDCGLLVVAGEGPGTRLLTKKKAPYRDVEIAEDLYRYILMCRVQVAPESPLETAEQRWRNWLARKAETRTLGYEVSKAIRERANEIESRNQKLERDIRTYDDLRAILNSLGVNIYTWNVEQDLRDKIKAHSKVFDPTLIGTLRGAVKSIEAALATIEELNVKESVERAA